MQWVQLMSRLPAVRSLFAEIERLVREIDEACTADDVHRFRSAASTWENWRKAYTLDELAHWGGATKDSHEGAVGPVREDRLWLAAEELRGRVTRDPGATAYRRLPDRLEEWRHLIFDIGNE